MRIAALLTATLMATLGSTAPIEHAPARRDTYVITMELYGGGGLFASREIPLDGQWYTVSGSDLAVSRVHQTYKVGTPSYHCLARGSVGTWTSALTYMDNDELWLDIGPPQVINDFNCEPL